MSINATNKTRHRRNFSFHKEHSQITSGSLKGDSQRGVDRHWKLAAEEHNLAARIEEDIRQRKDMAGRGVTFAEGVEQPWVAAQTYHPACPFQSCVASDSQKQMEQFCMRI